MLNAIGRIASAVVFAAFVFGAVVPALSAEAPWSLMGQWKITVKGERCANAQTVSINTATAKTVLGTTNVGDTYGKIVSGSFDGKTAKFFNKFVWDGKRLSENWTATLSRNGNYIKSSYLNTLPGSIVCNFSGPRQ